MIPRRFLLVVFLAALACKMTAQSDPPQAQSNASRQVEVPEGTSQGLLVYKVQPPYPPLARQARVQGSVVLQALIGKDGTVEELTVTSGHPLLMQAALDAVKQWRYKPYLVDGEPVITHTTITVNFVLGKPEATQTQASGSDSSASTGSFNPSRMTDSADASATVYGAYRVGGHVSPPRALYAPDPPYSDIARRAGYQGTVVLWLIVTEQGLPTKIRVRAIAQGSVGRGSDRYPVKHWKFEPAKKDGKAVPVMINVEVNFRLFNSPARGGTPLYGDATHATEPPQFTGVDTAEYPLVYLHRPRRRCARWQELPNTRLCQH